MTTIYVKQTDALPKRRDFDFYPTPLNVADSALRYLPEELPAINILDPGAGSGVWGKAARKRWATAHITGCELRNVAKPEQYDTWVTENFLLWNAPTNYDLVIGNPPYRHAEQFIRHSLEALTSHGYMILLLRLAFLEGKTRAFGLWRSCPPQRVIVCSQRVSFSGDGKAGATAYAFYLWQKGWAGETTLTWERAR